MLVNAELVNVEAASLFSLKNKTAVLTGASGFLGRSMARTLLCNGARVLALGRSTKLSGLQKGWSREFGEKQIKTFQVDMYDQKAFGQVLGKLASEEPSVDILINNAHEMGPGTGFNVPEGTLENASFDQWMRNLTGGIYWAAFTIQKMGPAMKRTGNGSIINVSSMYAQVAPHPQLYEGTSFFNPPGYSSAKAGLMGLTRYVASFWGKHGVRCNAILPGPFSNTEAKTSNSVKEGDPFIEKLKARTTLGRLGKPHELSGALLFLASDASSFVTGQSLIVDGGWTVT